MLSFKHLLATAFVVGSLLSSTAQAKVKIGDYVTTKSVVALVGAGVTYALVDHKTDAKKENKSLLEKTMDSGSKFVKAPINFYADHKDALHAAAAAYAVIFHGKKALNTVTDMAHYFGLKAPAFYAFYCSPKAGEAAAKGISDSDVAKIVEALAARLSRLRPA